MASFAVLFAVSLTAALYGCSNVAATHGCSCKTPVDTVYVERPGTVPDATYRSVPPVPGTQVPPAGEAPEPPDSSGSDGSRIEQPGRWSSAGPLIPGTARVETICAPIDSMTTYRMLGNLLDGRSRGSVQMEIDAETRRSYDGEVEYSLILMFPSRSSWQDRESTGDLLDIDAGGNASVSYDLGDIEKIVAEPLTTMSYNVIIWLPLTLRQAREIQSAETVTALLFEGSERVQNVFSSDNIINFQTFFEIFMVGDGTKSRIPEGFAPGAPVGILEFHAALFRATARPF
jgi:hypothetical protein